VDVRFDDEKEANAFWSKLQKAGLQVGRDYYMDADTDRDGRTLWTSFEATHPDASAVFLASR
jgi:hypothetical protein